MLARYVNDEFRAADKDFSSSMLFLYSCSAPGCRLTAERNLGPTDIDFDEFQALYKRLIVRKDPMVSR